MQGLIIAIRTLTIVPVPGRESERFASSLPWFSVIGLLLGLLLFGVGRLWTHILGGDWSGGGALLILLAGIILTRGLHLDGVADFADALGGPRDREKRLAIMKDSHVGAFGVIALILVLLSKWIALERLLSVGSLGWIPAVMVISRAMMAELIALLPYARPSGGMGKPFVEGTLPRQRVWFYLIPLGVSLCFGPLGPALFVLGWTAARLLGRTFRRMFNGITGDLLGATNEIIETSLLLICALPGSFLLSYTGWKWIVS